MSNCNTCHKVKCTCIETVITKQGQNGRNGKNGRKGDKGDKGDPGTSGMTSIVVNNTAFVMKNGNDSTGLVQRFDKPFLTITAAINALATAFPTRTNILRYRVIVSDGTYTETINLQKFIDIEFGNTVVDGCITDNNVDFGATNSGDWTNIVYGNSTFRNTTPGFPALLTYKPNTKLLMYCDKLISVSGDTVVLISGIVRLFANQIYSNATAAAAYAIEMAQGFSGGDFTYSKLEVHGCDISMPLSTLAPPINFASGGSSKNQELQLFNCRVKGNTVGAIMCGQQIASYGKLSLYNTILFSAAATSINVISPNTLSVYYYGTNMGSSAAGGGGTLTTVLGSLTVNAAIQAGF